MLRVVQALLDRLLRAEFAPVLRRMTQGARQPPRAVVALVAILAVPPAAGLTNTAAGASGRILALAAALGWTITGMRAAIFDAYVDRAQAPGEDEFHTRNGRTAGSSATKARAWRDRSWRPGSNRRPNRYKGLALPTELRQQ